MFAMSPAASRQIAHRTAARTTSCCCAREKPMWLLSTRTILAGASGSAPIDKKRNARKAATAADAGFAGCTPNRPRSRDVISAAGLEEIETRLADRRELAPDRRELAPAPAPPTVASTSSW
ncbi:hypothetical protein T492DRAFT_834114 [Pavlovales sp. CCMP2436]|nr:hypothetical protein T492DRAFT_834114 [Pavlovales sp. CCMP2436]